MRSTAAARPGGRSEQVVLDENQLAAGHYEYFALGVFAVSPNHRLLAYAVDLTGGERFTPRVRDLETGADLPDEIPNVYYGLAWANDSRTFFYTRPNDSMRPWQLWRHRVGTSVDEDTCVLQEEDERFFVGVFRTRSDAYVVADLDSMVTSEAYAACGRPDAEPRLLWPRRHGVEYHVDHDGQRLVDADERRRANFGWWTKKGASLLRTAKTCGSTRSSRSQDTSSWSSAPTRCFGCGWTASSSSSPSRSTPPGPATTWSSTAGAPLRVHVARHARQHGRLRSPAAGAPFASASRYDYDLDDYATERLWATASDGERILSRSSTVGIARTGPARSSSTATARTKPAWTPPPLRLSLLDRGFAYAIAHVRGGGERGCRWYENGKFQHKPNTFTDFIACAEHLVAEDWTAPDRLVARGGSAGGLLMGAVVNQRPDLFAAVVAGAFVDVVTTILDESPLTAIEWDEGDPRRLEFYELLKSYSPYDNVEPQDYPPDARDRRAQRPAGRVLGAGRSGEAATKPTTTACS